MGPAGVEDVVRQVAGAARAGVDLVQIRERDLDSRSLAGLVEACVHAVRGSRTRVVVNDRADVALASNAHGVHLRADSVAPWRVRRLLPRGFLVGRSVHAMAEVEGSQLDGADYVIFGPVFETASKPGVSPRGAGALEAIVRATSLPVLAVGGVTAATAAEIARTGAAGVAAIGLFAGAGGENRVQQTVEQLRKVFDSVRPRS
jgi:thiamine-phosphate pyrophosphorylase